jgi:general secretion pathway protein D
MQQERVFHLELSAVIIRFLLLAVLLHGCNRIRPSHTQRYNHHKHKIIALDKISLEEGKAFLNELDLGKVSLVPKNNAVLVTGTLSELRKASIILELVDGPDKFVIETLLPHVDVKTMPTKGQMAQALSDITFGTFTSPPDSGKNARAIIDVHRDKIVVIAPEHRLQDILDVIKLEPEVVAKRIKDVLSYTPEESNQGRTVEGRLREIVGMGDQRPTDFGITHVTPRVQPETDKDKPSEPDVTQSPIRPAQTEAPNAKSSTLMKAEPDFDANHKGVTIKVAQGIGKGSTASKPTIDSHTKPDFTPLQVWPVESSEYDATSTKQAKAEPDSTADAEHVTEEGRPSIDESVTLLEPSERIVHPPVIDHVYQPELLTNGDDILTLDLPEKISLTQLLDLVGEYLHFDYIIYEPNQIKDELVTLKLHGKLQGQFRVKDLYLLLESVLKSKGFVMTRHEDNLVTITSVENVMEADPQLVGPGSKNIELGDTVVTCVFRLQHIDASTAMNLLESMKLGLAVSIIDGAQTLIITCYAHRIGRIEQLLGVIDNPGRPKKFQFRQLKHTTANAVAKKVKVLAEKLQIIPITIVTTQKTPIPRVGASPRSSQSQGPPDVQPDSRQTVYLDSDGRTNRILMIGYEEQLAVVDELIDALDVALQDLRILRLYYIEHATAEEIKKKLEQLGIIGVAQTTGLPRTRPMSAPSQSITRSERDEIEDTVLEKPHVVVVASTNSLLINAFEEQHAKIEKIIPFIDAAPKDMRTLRIYNVEYVNADEVKRKLEELGFIHEATQTPKTFRTKPTSVPLQPTPTGAINTLEVAVMEKPQVVVLSATNSLLINANEEQHIQISTLLDYMDTQISRQIIPYEVYFLQNQQPEHLAEVLKKVVQETIEDKEGKVQQVIQKTDDQIVIIPEKETYSLIVYANRKNQEWIGKLVKILDRRLPQVLIDVTLVEIRKSDEFNYELNLISSFPDLTETGGQTGSFITGGQTVVDKLLQPGGRDRFVDFQANAGMGTGFYADTHVNALLEVIQTKDYGRILAKPKILVNDNQAGIIKSTNTTYVIKKSSIPVVTGAAGEQTNLIETAIDYEEYDAGITLEITPHISMDDLLSLDVTLKRSDFGTITGERPPDQTINDVNTVVTIPNGSTVILGGMVQLNQSKGGSKIPILGDLPLVGMLFRSQSSSDKQNKLYIFVRAEIIRPAEGLAGDRNETLERITDENRTAFEKDEDEFHNYPVVPGIKSKKVRPPKLLEAH